MSPNSPRRSAHPTGPAPPNAGVCPEGETHPKDKPTTPSEWKRGGRGWAPSLAEKECTAFPPRAEAGGIQMAALRARLAPWGDREEGMGTATPPGQGQPGSGRAARQPLRGNGRNEGGRKQILKGRARSGLDRLLFVSSVPKAGSTGHRPTRRRGVPAGRSGSCSRPPFFTATGGTRRLASSPDPTPPRTSPHFLSLPPSLLFPYTLLPE